MGPPAAVTITVDQAEAGWLWDFAKSDENYVSVNPYGVVWFNEFKEGAKPRRAYAVEVKGVTRTLEQTRSSPQLAPPQAGATEHPHVCKIRKLVGDLGNGQAWTPGYAEFNKGVANGLELAIATIQGRAPNYKHTPVVNPVETEADAARAMHLNHGISEAALARQCRNDVKLDRPEVYDEPTPSAGNPQLDQAKEHAQFLLRDDALTIVQYMAIFGELPE